MQVLLAERWAKEFPAVKFVSCHPGWCDTAAVELAYGAQKSYLEPMRTTWEGAEGIGEPKTPQRAGTRVCCVARSSTLCSAFLKMSGNHSLAGGGGGQRAAVRRVLPGPVAAAQGPRWHTGCPAKGTCCPLQRFA